MRFLADLSNEAGVVVVTVNGGGQARRHVIEVRGPEDAKKIGDAVTAYVAAVRRLRMTAARAPSFPGAPWWEK